MSAFWGPVTPSLLERARELHPDRFAPTGEPLIGYPGGTWEERLAAWRAAHPDVRIVRDTTPLAEPASDRGIPW